MLFTFISLMTVSSTGLTCIDGSLYNFNLTTSPEVNNLKAAMDRIFCSFDATGLEKFSYFLWDIIKVKVTGVFVTDLFND